MASAKTYAKLGLFTVIAFVALVVTAFALGVRTVRSDTLRYHTYFDESVQGLERGAPVKYRGVSIGTVSAIEIAPDRRHVDVSLSMKVNDIRRLGLAEGTTHIAIPPDLRTQLGSQGITGVKFVNIDFFDVKTNPAPKLPFDPHPDTIPAAASLMKGLEDSLAKAVDRLPDLLEAMVVSLGKIDRLLDSVDKEGIPQSLSRTIANLNGAITDLRRVVKSVDDAQIPAKTAKALDDVDLAISKVSSILERFDGDAGLMASTKRATDSVGDLGRSVHGSTAELERTLRDLGEAARSVRELADAIEHDPDMLVKGRSPARPR
ncbi:MAG: MCE family protein [Deltaproteobacteria bacterium]|nr:MCE family protein [Deltaproteobacteria bacterium]